MGTNDLIRNLEFEFHATHAGTPDWQMSLWDFSSAEGSPLTTFGDTPDRSAGTQSKTNQIGCRNFSQLEHNFPTGWYNEINSTIISKDKTMKAEFEFVAKLNDEDWVNGEPVTEISVIEMERYGKRGFLWYYNDRGVPHSTNEEGEGLWIGTDQQTGTMQYHLPRSASRAIRKIAKSFIQAQSNPGCGQIKAMRIAGKV